ncbi:MAG: hypothetical protein KGL62_16275 [Bradyrhizobium sp.]|uniref:hypothetical protein n=1 Tax=Bradyrhizobium sp. TaxID=376 RepID=UPI002397A1F8|nr:hypothetical protein [Bradyrhizobium sp.]MDE2603907.1 hypothetical protein [Bradyrhizobium sp.]
MITPKTPRFWQEMKTRRGFSVLCADSDEVASAYQDDLALGFRHDVAPGPVPLAVGLLALSRRSSIVLLI